MELKKGKRLKNRYEIVAVLGQGGFGYTYKAIDHLLNRFVAIKSSKQSLSHEAKILKELNNVPHISHMYEYFVENKIHYIVMRLIEGKSLSKYRIENGGTVNISFIKKFLPSVIITLDQIHKRGIIHRDISPANFIIHDENTLYLIDFGAATAVRDGLLKNKHLFSHQGLDSPEHMNADAQGPWTDVYSLCSSIVFLLTGEGIPSYTDRLISDPLPSLLLKMSLTAKMQNALISGLTVNPNKRFKSIEAFGKAFLGEDNHIGAIGKEYSVHYHARTDIGKRPVNQDNFMVDTLFSYAGEDCEIKGNIDCNENEIHIVTIADGVASSNHGEIASKAAIQAVSHFVDYYKYDEGLLRNLIEEFLNQLNEKIITLGNKIGKTATTIALFAWRNNEMCIANIGDSRIYKVKKGKIQCLSEDHTLAKYKISQGILPTINDFHIVTRYLGKTDESGSMMAYINESIIEKGDIYMICSDGISGISEDEQIKRWMKQDGDKAIKSIFNHAHRYETMDNCTAVVLKF